MNFNSSFRICQDVFILNKNVINIHKLGIMLVLNCSALKGALQSGSLHVSHELWGSTYSSGYPPINNWTRFVKLDWNYERSVRNYISDLESARYIKKLKAGRQVRYKVNPDLPFR